MSSYADYNTWEPWDIDFAASIEGLLDSYDNGLFPLSPEYLVNTSLLREELETGNYSQMEKAFIAFRSMDLRTQLNLSQAKYDKFVKDWKWDNSANERFRVESGLIPEYKADPTPWDGIITDDDVIEQRRLFEIWKKDQAKQEKIDAATDWSTGLAENKEAYIDQAEKDIEAFRTLNDLKAKSKELASGDIDKFISTMSQRMKLRGAIPNFSDSTRQQLIDERFNEYWSVENEQMFNDLQEKLWYVDDIDSTEIHIPTPGLTDRNAPWFNIDPLPEEENTEDVGLVTGLPPVSKMLAGQNISSLGTTNKKTSIKKR